MNAAPIFPAPSHQPKSGIVHLRNEVARYFVDNSVPAEVTPVGLKYRTFTSNQSPFGANRVVFIPGIFDGEGVKSRAYGSLSRDIENATSVVNPRELLLWMRPITISIWSAPNYADPSNEQDSVAIVEDLLEQVVRAITAAQSDGVSIAASVIWGDVTIVNPPNESSFGTELLVNLMQKGPLLDVTLEFAQATPVVTKG
jgi:hypothetical protein